MSDKVLIVDDDPAICKLLEKVMHSNDLETTVAASGADALSLIRSHSFDIILMDVMLGDMEGFEVIKKIRSQGISTPVMIVSGRNEDYDSLYGLSLGADDYITKPFKLAVLMSRINAVFRRSQRFRQADRELCSNGIQMRLPEGLAYKNGERLDLTAVEYKLLRYLMENPNQVLSAGQIMGRLWDCDENFVDGNTLTVYIRRLRVKIEDDPNQPTRIVTVRRMGYKWNTEN